MPHIEHYYYDTIIENDIEEVIINELVYSLDNLPPTVNKITIKISLHP